jgi:peptide/nickel transport system substrate-binding protein
LKFIKGGLKLDVSHFFFSFVLTFLVYAMITIIAIVNLERLSAVTTSSRSKEIVEGLFVPQSSVSASEAFNADPLLSGTGSESVVEIRKNVTFLVFSTLFKENIDNGLDNDLVDTYEFKDAKSVKITLKDNVLWHDGVRLTSEDVIYTLNLIKAVGQNGIYYDAVNSDQIDYKAVNEQEISITLSGSKGDFPNNSYLYELVFPILPKHRLENYSQAQLNKLVESDFAQNPIGSGKLKYYENTGSELVLIRNDEYYGDKVKFENYKIRFYKSYESLIKDFQLKNVDFFTRKDMVSEDEIHRNLISSGIQSYSSLLKDRRYLVYFNLEPKDQTVGPFIKSYSLRDGLMKVINRASILSAINGYGREIYGPIDQSSWAFLQDVQAEQVPDAEGFVKRVESLGYVKNGDYYEKAGVRLHLTLTYLSGEIRGKIATQIQSDLKQVGVEVKLNIIGETNTTADQFINIVNNRDFEVLLTAVNQFQDPDVYSEWHSTKRTPPGLNLAGLNSKIIDLSLVEGRIDPNQEKRKSNYIRFQKNFIQEVPAIYLINPAVVSYYSPHLANVEQSTINEIQYKYQNISNWEVK